MKRMNFFYIISALTLIILLTPTSLAFRPNLEQKYFINSAIDNLVTDEIDLDIHYIYNITDALSNIIFTEYDEENGEIAKGRAFGTKGEIKAAEILYENFSILGLDTKLEKLDHKNSNLPNSLVSKLEVLDYKVKINDEMIDCYIAPSWKGPRENPSLIDYNFSFEGLKIIEIPRNPLIFNLKYRNEAEDFVFIGKDKWNDPNAIMPFIDIFKPYLCPIKFYILFHMTNLHKIQMESDLWYNFYPNCKGLILYDFNKDCHDMIYFLDDGNSLPIIFINGSIGSNIIKDLSNYKLDFFLKQRYNDSVNSYNVIGEIEGIDKNKTVILSCLYDCWWNQGTADSAIGMAIVLGIAKYFVEADIKPKYNLRFIGFSGEEYGMKGALHYEAAHKDENIIAILDLNQIAFTQNEPRCSLDFVANKLSFLNAVMEIVEDSNYIQRTGNITDVEGIWWPSGWIPSNSQVFATKRPLCNAISIFKDGGWLLHHRDGLNHTEGDVLKYFNWTDTEVTAEIVLNITKYLVTDEYKVKESVNKFNYFNFGFIFHKIQNTKKVNIK